MKNNLVTTLETSQDSGLDVPIFKIVKFTTPTFGDHVLLMVEINVKIERKPNMQIIRDWRNYSVIVKILNIYTMLSCTQL